NRTEKQAAKVRVTEKALERLDVIEKPWEGWNLQLQIATAARSGAVVARLTHAVVARGSFVLGPIDLEIGWAERVAILGPNGSGKSTLLRTLLGELPLASGERRLGPGVIVGTLEQARGRFLGSATLLDAFGAASGLLVAESRRRLRGQPPSRCHRDLERAELGGARDLRPGRAELSEGVGHALGRRREPVPTLSPRDGAAIGGFRVPTDDDRNRLLRGTRV